MKYHKIRNVPMEECTAEQKIAYNIAFSLHISFQEQFDAIKDYPAVAVSDSVFALVEEGMKRYTQANDYKPGKYDLDAIQSALMAGIEKYMRKPEIFTMYSQIGKAFPAHYLDK